jgi:hypothetical protein
MIGATYSEPSRCGRWSGSSSVSGTAGGAPPSGLSPAAARAVSASARWRRRKDAAGVGCVSRLPSASVITAFTSATAAKLSWISWSVARSMKSVRRRLSSAASVIRSDSILQDPGAQPPDQP